MNETQEISTLFTAVSLKEEKRNLCIVASQSSDSQHGARVNECDNWLAALPSDAKILIGMFVGSFDEVTDLTLVSKKSFPQSEEVYKFLCQVTIRKGFFGGSRGTHIAPRNGKTWLDIAKTRKRIRVNGFYALKEMVTRAPCNDNFWEEKKVKSIETIHYRYFRFLDDGVVLYTLSTHKPWENPFGLEPHAGVSDSALEKETLLSWFTEAKKRKLREGVYRGYWYWGENDEKGTANVSVSMPYCELSFSFVVLNGDASYGNYHGNFSVLQCTRHEQVCSDGSSVSFTLPTNHDFIFYRRDYFRSDDSGFFND